jgi:uncharacterized protein YkwD
MIARLVLCAAVVCLAGEAVAQTAAAKPQPAVKLAGLKLLPVEQSIVDYSNIERARYGLPTLEVDADLMQSARQHATWMTVNQSLAHSAQPVAENIAMGQPHSQSVVQCWMNSPGHRANILDWSHRRIGVAAYRTPAGTTFWCQQFR